MHLAGPPPPPFESARWRRGKAAGQAEKQKGQNPRASGGNKDQDQPIPASSSPPQGGGPPLHSTAKGLDEWFGAGRSQRCRQLGGNGGRRGDRNSRLNEGERLRGSEFRARAA